MDKQKIVDFLNQSPLPASADHQRLVKRLNEQDGIIRYLLEALATQGRSILDIRDKMVEHKGAIEGLGDMITGEESQEPAIIMPHQDLVGFDR